MRLFKPFKVGFTSLFMSFHRINREMLKVQNSIKNYLWANLFLKRGCNFSFYKNKARIEIQARSLKLTAMMRKIPHKNR